MFVHLFLCCVVLCCVVLFLVRVNVCRTQVRVPSYGNEVDKNELVDSAMNFYFRSMH